MPHTGGAIHRVLLIALGAATLLFGASSAPASAPAPAPATAPPNLAVRAEIVYTMAGEPIKDGVILIRDGSAVDDALSIDRLSEEHATVRVTGATRLEPGDRVRVLPNHSCTVSNLVDAVHLVEGDALVDTLPISARGRIV